MNFEFLSEFLKVGKWTYVNIMPDKMYLYRSIFFSIDHLYVEGVL